MYVVGGELIRNRFGRAGVRRMLEEAAKCDIVCPDCHRERTYQRRQRAGEAQQVVREFSKLDVAGSNPVSRSRATNGFSPRRSLALSHQCDAVTALSLRVVHGAVGEAKQTARAG